ncbi:hypothetical protein HY798_04420 [Candidatus Falkowbacteria bacterium]|nr:hypothetical protein [Candidatus Falkowbacteria bacterium]
MRDEINFLQQKDGGFKQGKEEKKDKESKEERETEWSKTNKDEPSVLRSAKESRGIDNKKNKIAGWLSFFKKTEGRPQAGEAATDKEKIKHSRREILKLIQEHEEKEASREKIEKEKVRKFDFSSFFSRPFKIFRKREGDKNKISVDYQKVFRIERKEKKKGEAPARLKKREVVIFQPLAREKKEKTKIYRGKWSNFIKFCRKFFAKIGGARRLISAAETKQKEEGREEAKDAEKEKSKQEEKQKKEEIKKGKKISPTPSVLETSLIQEEIISFFDWQKNIMTLLTFVALTCLIVGVVWEGLILWEKSKKETGGINFTLEFDKLAREIKEEEKGVKEILNFQNRLKLTAKMLADHIYWTNFFKFLEDNTIANVYYLSFSGDNAGKYALAAKAKDFHAVAEQVKAMRNSDQVLEVNVGGGKLGSYDNKNKTSAINFELRLTVNPGVFKK